MELGSITIVLEGDSWVEIHSFATMAEMVGFGTARDVRSTSR